MKRLEADAYPEDDHVFHNEITYHFQQFVIATIQILLEISRDNQANVSTI